MKADNPVRETGYTFGLIVMAICVVGVIVTMMIIKLPL